MADSKTHNRKLNYLKDLKDYKMAKNDPDVRGWEVHDSNHQSVGTVAGLVIDVSREKVRYIDVEIDETILPGDHDPFSAEHEDGIHEYQDSEGSIHMIIPVGVARIDAEHKTVIADGIDQNSLRNIPTYRYRENTPVHSDYEQSVLANFKDKDRPEDKTRNLENENRNLEKENRDLEYENRNRDIENRNQDIENRNRDDETRNRNDIDDDDDQYNSEHFNEDRFYGRDRK